ncbi:peroxiredoxin family protein [Salidesulfovibrio onnuriiensis]|uniref:peroxiredoxin family protein n=1 Tax=Salidesulfovibrio onnuriiensis TaxID=2583823 RepID=UPI0011C96509|nr:redoxin domain-containing protein [Salidesulfovibrio onnuriiensis]
MKKVLFATLILSAFLAVVAQAGEPFPDIVLRGTLPSSQKDYLGIDSAEPKFSDVAGKFVLVEFISMYCPVCQREAPTVNEIFHYLDERGYSGRIKMLGIGTGNSQFEVDYFRTKYSVDLPLFTDQDFKAHKAVGNVQTPWYALVRKYDNGRLETVFTHAGDIDSKDEFLQDVLEAAGYRQ